MFIMIYLPTGNIPLKIYIVVNPDVSRWLEGKTFIEYSKFLLENRCALNPAIPIGYRRGKEIFVNPKEEC
jgi:hypothetical protein